MSMDDVSEAGIVEIYWRPGCGFCTRLYAKLERTGLPIREVNIWEDADAAARVRSVTGGHETVPTVFVGDRAMVNPGIDDVLAAVRQVNPDLVPPSDDRPLLKRWLSPRQ